MRYLLSLVVLLCLIACESDKPLSRAPAPQQNRGDEQSKVGAPITVKPEPKGLFLPEGDPRAGKLAFHRLKCWACHEVAGEDFPRTFVDPPVPIMMVSPLQDQSREQLAESIMMPSHKVSDTLPGVKSGDLSRMGDFSQTMTVRELIDIVAFLKNLKS
ncbi:MAG: c-type cytochrome [Phycisphaeraceae bacterium]